MAKPRKSTGPKFPPRQQYKPPPVEKFKAAVESYRLVYVSGVGPLGPVHRQALLSTGGYTERTVCGSWPGRPTPTTPVLDAEDRACPVCFKGVRHAVGA